MNGHPSPTIEYLRGNTNKHLLNGSLKHYVEQKKSNIEKYMTYYMLMRSRTSKTKVADRNKKVLLRNGGN